MYIGRALVHCKKLTSHNIDEYADKMHAKEEKVQVLKQEQLEERLMQEAAEKFMQDRERERKRHASLPDTLLNVDHEKRLAEQAKLHRKARCLK